MTLKITICHEVEISSDNLPQDDDLRAEVITQRVKDKLDEEPVYGSDIADRDLEWIVQ